MHYPGLATVITQSEIHVQIKHSLEQLQHLIHTFVGTNTNVQLINQSKD